MVTDRGLSKASFIKEIEHILKAFSLDFGIFSGVRPNPIGATVESGVQVYLEGNHDGVIAIGGGSSLDTGKAIAFMSGQSESLWNYAMADFSNADGLARIVNVNGIAPVISVPTTAGTGSEIGRAAAIVDESLSVKKALFHKHLMPRACIADPELTLELPGDLTAATGMDALSHNIEAFCCPFLHPMSDGLAIEGMRLIKEALPRAVSDGTDLQARSDMLAASILGGGAFQKGVGAMHALSHPCSGIFDLHHGLVNAVLMPYVLKHNATLPSVDHKLTAAARYLDLKNPSTAAMVQWTIDLRKSIGIPNTLSDLGVEIEDIQRLAPMASADVCSGENPLPLTTETCAELYHDAITGNLE